MQYKGLDRDLFSFASVSTRSASPESRCKAESGLRILYVGGEDHGLRIPFILSLRARGFDIHAAACCEAAPFEESGIPFHYYPFTRRLDPLGDWAAIKALRTIVDRVAPDIVQSFDTKPNLFVALLGPHLSRRTRIVRTINGTGRVHSSASIAARCLRPIYNTIQRQAARVRAATIFHNDADRKFFIANRMAHAGTARLIPGSGVDIDGLDRARAQAAPPQELRAQLGLTGRQIVMTVTRIEPLKGIRTLLAAAEIVHGINPDVQFVLVGPWENAASVDRDLQDLCRRSPALRWIGPRSDIQALLSLADVFVLPTEFREGLPRVLLEAAVAGLPVVSTDMPGCMSVVEHGKTGLLVPPRAPGTLAAAIVELLVSPHRAKAMGMRGSLRTRRDFSLRCIVEQYARLYDEIAYSA